MPETPSVPQKHIINTASTPPPRALSITVATNHDDEYEVLYIGASLVEAEKAAHDFDEAKHKEVQILRSPVAYRRFNSSPETVVHHTPLKPGMTIAELKAGKKGAPLSVEKTNIHPPQPESFDDQKPRAGWMAKVRENELRGMTSADLKEVARASGISGVDEMPADLDNSARDVLILGILEKEFPAPSAPGKTANKLGGLGK